MGIKYLNKFLKESAADSMKFISISELSGKRIAVDISIYMYKYASEDSLIENMYLLLSVLRYYNVIPIFIFDGKPPDEKKDILLQRREDKKEAEKEYNKIKNLLHSNPNMEEADKQELVSNMDILKKKFVHISKTDVENVKNLIRAYGATYYDAPGEADELCALLTIKGKVFATLSEDMDMFVYGCPKVLRYLSLLNHTAVLYNMKDILGNLGITQKELREICVLSGTDYNKMSDDCRNPPNLYTTLKFFKKYHKLNSDLEFYDWLNENTNYINNYQTLKKIYDMFDLNQHNSLMNVVENIKIINTQINTFELKNILKSDGFLFP
jgi:flap endonuclease-1